MKNRMNRVRKALCSLGLLALIMASSVPLTSAPAAAGPVIGPPPILLCGWSTLWDCTLPDGSHQIVGGTQCDIALFEQQTGATCEILRF